MTAGELAEALEVSVRTVYRDVEALSTAGVPIYGESGPGGGYALLESYRTNLTGLSEDEVRALFMLTIPAPLDQLGMGAPLKAALLKLSAAVAPIYSADEQRVRQRFYIDAVWWHRGGDEGTVPALRALQTAVWHDRSAVIRYRIPPLARAIELEVAPYALVAKAGVWHLVYARGEAVRVIRVAELLGIRILEERFERPADFDLPAFWRDWCTAQEDARVRFPVTVCVAPALQSWVSQTLSPYLRDPVNREDPAEGVAGWVTMALAFESLEDARRQLLPLGGAVEVLQPRSLRRSMADYGEQIRKRYADDAS